MSVTIDENALEPLGTARYLLAVRAQAGAAGARTSEGLSDHDVDVDPVRGEPPPRILLSLKMRCGKEALEERFVCKLDR